MVYPIARHTIIPLFLGYVKKIYGSENFPKDIGFIIAPNHESYLDDLIIPSIVVTKLNKKLHFYVNNKYLRNFFLRTFLLWGGCIPVEVRADSANSKERSAINEKAFKTALELLKQKEIIGIFPEGHRSQDGKL